MYHHLYPFKSEDERDEFVSRLDPFIVTQIEKLHGLIDQTKEQNKMQTRPDIEYIQRDVGKDAVIFDLDGCVSNDAWRTSRLPADPHNAEPVAFDFYHAGCGDDPPMEYGANVLRDAIDDGKFIIFATARPQKVIELTSNWIQRHFFIKPNADFMILCRPDDDPSPSALLKSKMVDFLQQWQAEGQRKIVCAYDDREDVISMYRERGLEAYVLDVNGIGVHRPDTNVAGSEVVGERCMGWDLAGDQDGDPAEHVPSRFVSETLERTLETFKDRAGTYGENDIMHGRVMKLLFPDGVALRSEKDHRMFLMMTHVVGKLTRFAASGMRHKDSAHDAIVYMAFVELLADQHDIKVAL